MLTTKEDLVKWLKADSINYDWVNSRFIKKLKNRLLSDPISDTYLIWKYIKTLRKVEFYLNHNNGRNFLFRLYYLHKLRKLSHKTGFQIPPNVIGPGLTIYHFGPIIINARAVIGNNLTIQPQVVIGQKKGESVAPVIGDNVVICGGCFIIGNIHIGNNVIIAPNSSVISDIPDNCVIAGSPARIVKRL